MSSGLPESAAQRNGPIALAEERAHVGLDETGVGERVGVAGRARLGAQAVAVVEDDRPELLEAHHRGALARHRRARLAHVAIGIRAAQPGRLLDRVAGGDVAAERVVRRGLVGHDVRHDATGDQLLEHLGGVADEADRAAVALRPGLLDLAQRGVEVGGDEIEVARLDAAVEVVRVDVDDQADAVVHRDGERLRARPCRHSRRSARSGRAASRRSGRARRPRTSRTCPARSPGCRCRSTSRPSSGRTSSGPRPRAAGTCPSRPTPARGASSRSARAAPARACGRRRRACPTARASSRRRRAAEASRRSRRRPPTSGPRDRCRRTRRGCPGPRPRRGRGCSSACGAQPPATSLGTRARGREGRARDGGRRVIGRGR